MSRLFLIILTCLIVFTQWINFRDSRLSGKSSGQVPFLQFSIGTEPTAKSTVKLFREWLAKKAKPDLELRLEDGLSQQKIVTQGVAGVAPDIFPAGSSLIPYYKNIGICADLTSAVHALGLTEKNFYTPALGDFRYGEEWFAMPYLTSLRFYMVNIGRFQKVGLAAPSGSCSFEEFENLGKEYVRRANAGSAKQQYFFADTFPRELMLRSVGISYFNETLSAPDFTPEDARFVRVLELIRKWTYEDHLAPTEAEMSSFSTESGSLTSGGGWGAEQNIFYQGKFALHNGTRRSLKVIRECGSPIELGALEAPHGGFPNTIAISVSLCGFTKSSKADYFQTVLDFLFSEDFNLKVIHDGDDLPPNPVFHHHPELLNPIGHTNEWPLHEGVAKIVDTITYGRIGSPWLLFQNAQKIEMGPISQFMYGRITAKEAVAIIHAKMSADLAQNLKRHPETQADYQARIEKQRHIDELKASGKPVPLELIENTFLRAYLQKMGKAK